MAGEIRQSIYDNAIDLVLKVTEQYGEAVVLSGDTTQRLSGICELIEAFIQRVDCEYCDVGVLLDTMQLVITVVCDEVIVSRQDSGDFYKLISMVDGFSVIRHGPETLRIEFRLNHVWRKR